MSKQTDTNVLRQKRAQLHQPVAPAIGRVRFAKLKMPGGKQCARVVPGETLTQADFIRRLCERNPGLAPITARFYLEAVFAELAECLREGRFVTFEGIAHFGVSIKGTLAEDDRQLNATHALRPWARFLTPFANTVNEGAYLAPVGQLPVKIAFKQVTVQGRMIIAEGKFRSPAEPTFVLLPAQGASIPCELIDADTSATRHECTRLYLRAATELPAQPLTLHASWFDATGTAQEVEAPIPAAL